LHGFKSNALTWTNDNDNLTGEYESPSNLIGQEGRFVFKFTPNKVGTQEMKFHYKRPWEKNKEPVYIARYFVNVVE
jgi:predicted secreted protein